VHLPYAQAARTATSTNGTGLTRQPSTPVQPTHALIITDNKAKQSFSKYYYHIQLGHFTTLVYLSFNYIV
jgi:hypothetical protein